MDDPDEGGPPPPSRPRRTCGTPGCRRPAQPRGFTCGACTVARWRERHREIAAERERARLFSDEQEALRRARAWIGTYVRRGAIERGKCEVCGDRETVPAWNDPAVPRDVRWFCREHRNDRAATARALAASQAGLRDDIATVAAAAATLPPEVRRRLHEAGLRGLTGGGAAPGTLWYWTALRLEYLRWLDEQNPLV